MSHIKKTNECHSEEIGSCVNDFCSFIRSNQVQRLYGMLSPNLQQLVLEERHQDKFQSVFIFGRKIVGQHIYKMTEINSGIVEALVIVSVIPVDSPKSYQEVTADDLNYRVYKMRFIDIDSYWYVDDVQLYNEFWGNEFKNDHL
jgi:hypothetical protein